MATSRLEGKVRFQSLDHARAIKRPGSDRGWNRVGSPWTAGNYRLNYRDCNGDWIRFSNFAGYKLMLELENNSALRVDVTSIKSGHAIGLAALTRFLDHVNFLGNKWGGSVDCRLVVKKNGVDVSTSDSVAVATPVKPWAQPLDPELFAGDTSIKYCGDPGAATRRFYGRTLRDIGGRRYFTFKGALETDQELRGFDCIVFAGTVYQVRADEDEEPYSGGDHMAYYLDGSSFDWPDRPEKGKFREMDIEYETDEWEFEKESAYVRMSRWMVLKFLETNQGKTGSYLIWTPGHVGLIRSGVLYECKPSGKGFTKEVFTESTEGAVRKYNLADLSMGDKALKVSKYNLAKLP